MTERFAKLDKEKQQRIILAAMREFARGGYRRTGTDGITAAAGISKGLLFHYFGTKKKFYLFLVDYALETMKRDILPQMDKNPDILQRLLANGLLKVRLYSCYPELIDFYTSISKEHNEDVVGEIQARLQAYARQAYSVALADVDKSLFREDVDSDKAIDIITWTMEGHGNQVLAQLREEPVEGLDFGDLNRQFEQYINILRKCLYKKGVCSGANVDTGSD